MPLTRRLFSATILHGRAGAFYCSAGADGPFANKLGKTNAADAALVLRHDTHGHALARFYYLLAQTARSLISLENKCR